MACWRFDGHALTRTGVWGGLRNPSYLLVQENLVYAVEELPDRAGIACLSWERDGEPELLWHRDVPGAGLCHLALDGETLYASGYDGGTLTGVDRNTGELLYFREFSGRGPHPTRQEKAHIHSCQRTLEGGQLIVADLGTDRLYRFRTETKGGLTLDHDQPWVSTKPGQGPRHFAFHPNGKWLYLVTELDSSLLVYRRWGDRLEQTGEYSLLEQGDPAESLAADIHLTGDGKYLYASVRGADCLCCFQVEEEGGVLNQLERVSSQGSWPRNFALSPQEEYVAVANQQSGTLVIFPRGEDTGRLGAPLCQAPMKQISCVQWER